MPDLIGDLGDVSKVAPLVDGFEKRALLALAAMLRGAADGLTTYVNPPATVPPKP